MATAFLVLSAILTLLHLASCAIVALRLRAVAPVVTHRPCVTLLRPVCGIDSFDEATLGSSFRIDWPDYEIIFCAARADDPAVALVRRLIARNPQVPARLLLGEERISGNPKLNNLAKGWRAARGARIVMADANLMLPPDYFARLLSVEDAATGLVTSPPVGTVPDGFWGAVEAAFLNGNQARLQLSADALGAGFAQGKTLMWQRDVLEHAGGLAALGRTLAEDVAATQVVRAAGLRVRLARIPFAQPIGRRDRAAVWARQLRWSRVRRDGFPALFLLEPLNGALVPAGLAGVALGPSGALCVAALHYGAELALCRRAGWPVGWAGLPAMVTRDLMMPLLWGATFARRGFEWRGNVLSPQPPDPPSRAPSSPVPPLRTATLSE
ncbi:MAG: hypothetical protein RIR62_619 [Pseudomonadota bacterium]|jgi:ceramide glucosyltransferase